MIIRKTTRADIGAIDKIYRDAKIFMRENGNPTQWRGEYPNALDATEDIDNGGYVCEDDGEIVAVFYFHIGNDKTYDVIYDGKWLNDEPYAVIHRIAVAKRGRGIAAFCFDECYKMFPNLKIDTHKDNIAMQRALEKSGFEYCGIIHLENGEERIAFQKV